MALTLPCDTREEVSVGEYVEYIRRVDLTNQDAIAESAAMLRALANDRTLVVQRINQEIEKSFRSTELPSAQTIFLGGGKNFYVRAAIWPSSAAISSGHLYQDKFAYHIAHDHNFSFLTVNYLGPGYETEIYEYDYEAVEGYAGEPVQLRFLEKVKFAHGTVMLYRASQDVHIQYPPEELSVTLNLMISTPEIAARDQYYFDTARRVIMHCAPDTDASKNVSLMKMAGYLGDANTQDLLTGLAKRHPNRRARLQAFEALAMRDPTRADEIWRAACDDPASLVVNVARQRLKLLEAS
jgi:hypothetical protein